MVLSSTLSHKSITGHNSVELELLSTIFISEGSQADNLTIEAEQGSSGLGVLSMNGAGVFSFVVKHLRSAVNQLRENAHASSEITWYVHQGSRAVVDSVEKVLEVPQGSLFRAESYGNVVGSTLPIQIFEDVETFKNNQELGLLAFGVGLTFAGAILRVVK
jgi:VCBS repeat-containing protein